MRIRDHVVWLGALLAGCKSEASRQASDLDTSISWLATTEAVAQAWSRNRIPATFARQTIIAARERLVENGETDAGQVVSAVQDVVRRGDRDGIDEPLAALRDSRQQLEDRRSLLRKGQ